MSAASSVVSVLCVISLVAPLCACQSAAETASKKCNSIVVNEDPLAEGFLHNRDE